MKNINCGMARLFCLAFVFYASTGLAYASYPGAYTGPSDVRAFSLAPDGKHIAVLMEIEDPPAGSDTWDIIKIKDTASLEVKSEYSQEFRAIFDVNWFSDTVLIGEGRLYKRARKKWVSSEVIVAIDVETETTRTLFSVFNGEMSDDPSDIADIDVVGFDKDQERIMVSYELKSKRVLVAVDINSGIATELARGPSDTDYWLFDDEFNPIIRVNEGKSENIQVYSKPGKKGKWEPFQTLDLTKTHVSTRGFDPEDITFTAMYRPDSAQRTGLYRWHLNNPDQYDLLYEHPVYDLFGYRLNDGDLLYAGWLDEYFEKHWLDEKLKSSAAILESKLPKDQNWNLLQMNTEENIWLIYAYGPRNPGEFLIWDGSMYTLQSVANVNSELEGEDLAFRKAIKYKASDDLELSGYFTPAEAKNDKNALIVLPHGGPVVRDYQEWDGWAQFLAHRGYDVFQPNYRGSGGYGRAFEEKGFREWSLKMQTDIEDGVAYLEAAGLIERDIDRAVVGSSYGGYAALTAAFKTPDRYKCIASINGLSDLPAFLDSFETGDVFRRDARKVWVDRIGDPAKDSAAMKAASAIFNLDKIKAKVQLMHGTADEIVPYDQSKTFYDKAKEAGVNVRLNTLQGVGHGGWSERTSTNILTDIDTFLLTCM